MKRFHSLIWSSAISLLEVAITHCQAIKLGVVADVYTANNIINGYTKCRELCMAREFFNEMFHRDIVSWNTMISGYINSDDHEVAWSMLKTMKRCGYQFDEHTFGSVLKGVASSCYLALGQQIHSIIFKMGFSKNVFSGGALLNMYAKCGRVEDAYAVFQSIPEPNYVSWNALIAGYCKVGDRSMAFWLLKCMEQEGVNLDDGTISPLLTLLDDSKFYRLAMQLHCKIVKHGLEFDTAVCNATITAYSECGSLLDAKTVFDGSDAFRLFVQMRSLVIEIDRYSFSAVIRSCSDLATLQLGQQFHGLAVKGGFESNEYVGSSLIFMYSKCGIIEDARRSFEATSQDNAILWNSIIFGYAQHGQGEIALDLFYLMRDRNVKLDHYTFSAVIRSCSDLATLQLGQQFHGLAVKVGFESNEYVGNSLIFMYSKCGIIEDARRSFEATSQDNAIGWNSIIFGYAQHGQGEIALDLFYLMRDRNVKLDHYTFSAVIRSCSDLATLQLGQQFHGLAVKGGFESNEYVGSSLIFMYSKCGIIEDARRSFEATSQDNAIGWNSIIFGYAQHGQGEIALDLFYLMRDRNVKLDHYTFSAVIRSCSDLATLQLGQQFHGLAVKGGFESNEYVGSSLIFMYSKCGIIEDARRSFEATSQDNAIGWNSIIFGYAQHGQGEIALHLFYLMRDRNVKLDHYTFSAVIRSCSDLATLQLGQQFHGLAVKVGFESNEYVGSSLIFMYSKCGIIEDARRSFEATSQDNAIVWNSIIFGYAQHGQGEIALDLFYLMRDRKVKLDHITFVAVLTACSHNGMVEEGSKFLESMESDFGIPPRMEHYACAIDLYGRAGCLEKAKALVETMPFEPDTMVWKTLLGACRLCGDIELASMVGSWLLELEPEEHCTYVLLSDIYGRLKMWDEKANITRLMRERGVKKVPGWSWIEVKNEVHAFNAEDHSHPQCKEIYLLLEGLMEEITLLGSVAAQMLFLQYLNLLDD